MPKKENVVTFVRLYKKCDYLFRQPLSSQSRVYRFTQLRTDGVHQESAGTGPVVLTVVQVTDAAYDSENFMNQLLFGHFSRTHYWYEVGIANI